MSWSIGLSLGEYFAELTAVHGRQKKFHRWFLPKLSLTEGLDRWLVENSELKGSSLSISTRTALLTMRHRSGSQVALLVTSGFEEWPYIRQPVKDQGLTLNPRRFKPLVSQDLIFGITERISSEGEVLTTLSLEDLEFLIPKLQLTETKQVAIGFLNSHKNPTHERNAAEILRAAGFEVLCSHEIPETGNEVARWWRAVLNAYVAPTFHELEGQLAPLAEKHELKLNFIASDGSTFTSNPSYFYSSAFGSVAALTTLSKAKKSKAILHFGLEQFLIVDPLEKQPIWQSQFGPVAITTPRFTRLRTQPTQLLEYHPLTGVSFSQNEVGFEPGPMLLGRSLRPTVLDVLYDSTNWESISGLSEWVTENSVKKIEQTLKVLFKDQFENAQDIHSALRELCEVNLCQEIAHALIESKGAPSTILCTGAFAPHFSPILQEKIPEFKFVSEKQLAFAESLSGIASSAGTED